ncbi:MULTISPECIES: glycosyltransferase family 2 protein [Calothrix]|uniref:Glycosyltransferase family 2 protein n=2 Tax=Calothrix TaxID=1186 RepID=A0ABR8ADQ9_9CYAN|nr:MULTISPECIES: glycosyltransferase family 2 protein [Calothrix]MBD2197365.1 glycosyltransferase family 2 protein [Calothrix parietina FACHB-288]MBD2228177.1 glycosyltransferase family 2 protein [Calothrix anomala FACHB-343]
MKSNSSPEVSVIIPAYNTSGYIARAIESALGQTLKNIEVIVVDDASTDNTLEVIKSFKDERLKVFVNQENLGAGGSRNRALKEAKGNWIAVLDSDDWYAPERLERLVQVAYQENADMIADDLYLIKDGEEHAWSTLIKESGEYIPEIKQINPVYFVKTDVYGKKGLHLGISKPLFKRHFLMQENIQYNQGIKVAEDFWLALTCLVRGARFSLVPEPYYFYLARPGSLVYTNKITFLTQNCAATVTFIEKEQILSKLPQLADALSANYRVLQDYLSYYKIVEPLKDRKWLKALKEILYNPKFFLDLCLKLPGIINRRIQFYIFGNQAAYDIFS